MTRTRHSSPRAARSSFRSPDLPLGILPGLSSRANTILTSMYARKNPANIAGMARFGITSPRVLGLTTPYLRELKRSIGTDHGLALQLWSSGVLEARILAALIADPKRVTRPMMNAWVREFDNWAICDGVCIHLFRRTADAHAVAPTWARRRQEFIRRAGFVMMATLTVHDKTSPDAKFRRYLPLIKQGATDERNFVKKAVNWALRQIGKRNAGLHRDAVRIALVLKNSDNPAARWIGTDALNELQSPSVLARLKKHPSRRR